MYKCKKCGNIEPTNFYSYCKSECKTCVKDRVKKNYQLLSQNPEWVLQERVRTRDKYHKLGYGSKYNKIGEAKKEIIDRYFAKNPQKKIATRIVSNAIKSGKLIKQPCEVCGAIKVEAHHDDYTKPLDVRWLCIKHHNEYHVELRKQQLLSRKPD